LVKLVGVTLNVTPLQVTEVIAVIVANGIIVTVTENMAPVHDADNGVTRYVAVLAILVVLVNVPKTFVTAEACVNPPVKPEPVGAGHV
jgi:hypothetical protein